jgi:hypothetical protein
MKYINIIAGLEEIFIFVPAIGSIRVNEGHKIVVSIFNKSIRA